MSHLTHITRCLLCAPENAYEVSAGGFDPIDPMNPQIPSRVERFLLELFGHLQKTGEREAKRMQKANVGKMNQLEAARLVAEKAKHFALVQSVMLSMQWAQGFGVLNAFDLQDPELQRARHNVRYLLHSMTAARVPDDTLRSGIAKLGLDAEQAGTVFSFVRELLDAASGIPPQAQPQLVALK